MSQQPAACYRHGGGGCEGRTEDTAQHSQGDEESMVQLLGFQYRIITGEARAAAFVDIGLELCKIAM